MRKRSEKNFREQTQIAEEKRLDSRSGFQSSREGGGKSVQLQIREEKENLNFVTEDSLEEGKRKRPKPQYLTTICRNGRLLLTSKIGDERN